MKSIWVKHPWTRVLLYFTVLGLATWISGKIPALSDFWFFMLVAICCSWLLLRIDRRSLASVHLLPVTRRHWLQLLTGILAGCAMLLLTALITFMLTGNRWHLRVDVNGISIAIAFLTCLWSSVVQEFAFRGYPFQTVAEHYGPWVAQGAIAVPFALMHLRYGMNAATILTIVLTTGLGSLLFGLAYIKTRHLALSVGLHLGWNFAQQLIPRTICTNKAALISVSGELHGYTFFNVVMPYVIVMLIAIGIVLVWPGNKQPAGQRD